MVGRKTRVGCDRSLLVKQTRKILRDQLGCLIAVSQPVMGRSDRGVASLELARPILVDPL